MNSEILVRIQESDLKYQYRAGLAQTAERQFCKLDVVGATPTTGSKRGRVAEWLIALVLKTRGGAKTIVREFESHLFFQGRHRLIGIGRLAFNQKTTGSSPVGGPNYSLKLKNGLRE